MQVEGPVWPEAGDARGSGAIARAITWVVESRVALAHVTPASAKRNRPAVSQRVGIARCGGAAPVRNIGKPIAAVTYQGRARRHGCAQDGVGVGEIQAEANLLRQPRCLAVGADEGWTCDRLELPGQTNSVHSGEENQEKESFEIVSYRAGLFTGRRNTARMGRGPARDRRTSKT